MRIAVVAPERWLALLVFVCASCSTGCTLVGFGVGASTARWERDVQPVSLESFVDEGVRPHVRVKLQPGPSTDVEPGQVSGTYVRLQGDGASPVLVVATHEGEQKVPLQSIDRIDVRTGTFAATGAIVGGVIDAVVFTLLTYAVVGIASSVRW